MKARDIPMSFEEQLRRDCPAVFQLQEAAERGGAAMPYGRHRSALGRGFQPIEMPDEKTHGYASSDSGMLPDRSGPLVSYGGESSAKLQQGLGSRMNARQQHSRPSARDSMLYGIKTAIDELPDEALRNIFTLIRSKYPIS